MPLHGELIALDARLRNSTATTPEYRLYALDTVPPKPGLVRVGKGGYAIQVEVYDLPIANIGVFLAGIASPLGLGTVNIDNVERSEKRHAGKGWGSPGNIRVDTPM